MLVLHGHVVIGPPKNAITIREWIHWLICRKKDWSFFPVSNAPLFVSVSKECNSTEIKCCDGQQCHNCAGVKIATHGLLCEISLTFKWKISQHVICFTQHWEEEAWPCVLCEKSANHHWDFWGIFEKNDAAFLFSNQIPMRSEIGEFLWQHQSQNASLLTIHLNLILFQMNFKLRTHLPCCVFCNFGGWIAGFAKSMKPKGVWESLSQMPSPVFCETDKNCTEFRTGCFTGVGSFWLLPEYCLNHEDWFGTLHFLPQQRHVTMIWPLNPCEWHKNKEHESVGEHISQTNPVACTTSHWELCHITSPEPSSIWIHLCPLVTCRCCNFDPMDLQHCANSFWHWKCDRHWKFLTKFGSIESSFEASLCNFCFVAPSFHHPLTHFLKIIGSFNWLAGWKLQHCEQSSEQIGRQHFKRLLLCSKQVTIAEAFESSMHLEALPMLTIMFHICLPSLCSLLTDTKFL